MLPKLWEEIVQLREYKWGVTFPPPVRDSTDFGWPQATVFFFNSYFYYLTRGCNASARVFNLLTRAFDLPTRVFNLATRAFYVLTREFDFVTGGFELLTRIFGLINSPLITRAVLFDASHLLWKRHRMFRVKFWEAPVGELYFSKVASLQPVNCSASVSRVLFLFGNRPFQINSKWHFL